MWNRSITLLLLTIACASAGYSQEFANGVQLTTMKAPFVLRILGQDLDIRQANADQEKAYFSMTSGTTKLNVSVFIEPIGDCKTAVECRDHVLGAGNPRWGGLQDLKKGKMGEASYFEFYRPEVDGKPVKMLDMYAEFVRDGYWLDMHISKVLYDEKDHALFESVVSSAQLISKSDKTAAAFDSTMGDGLSATGGWLAVWDKAKCSESYAGLSSVTRSGTSEANWTAYCKKTTSYLGPLLMRQPIAATFTNSPLSKTDRPLGVVAYYSEFTNRPAGLVEVVPVLLEKNGRWAVTNYLLQ